MKTILIVVLWLLSAVTLANVPPNAKLYLPVLQDEVITHWPSLLNYRDVLAGQIEQESCVSLKSKRCWSPFAELKTDREYGFGLGQITITSRFNTFVDLKKQYKPLSDWNYEDRFNPHYQIRAIVLMDKGLYDRTKNAATVEDRLFFTLSQYNSGPRNLAMDRLLCRNTAGCDPTRWFNHVETHSYLSRIAVKGYGQSWYDINRGYVKNIWTIRRFKYKAYYGI